MRIRADLGQQAAGQGLEMTMNVYGHVNVETQRAALDRLDDELSG